MSNRTLRNVRHGAPETDRNDPALVPSETPHWATARDGTRYVHIYLYPRTLDELRKQCREFGTAAVADLEWSCILRWLMASPDEADLSNAFPAALTATRLMQGHDRARLGLPRHDGKLWDPPALNLLSVDARDEAERVATETAADWTKAGKPFLGESSIKTAYRRLVSSPDFTGKYVRL